MTQNFDRIHARFSWSCIYKINNCSGSMKSCCFLAMQGITETYNLSHVKQHVMWAFGLYYSRAEGATSLHQISLATNLNNFENNLCSRRLTLTATRHIYPRARGQQCSYGVLVTTPETCSSSSRELEISRGYWHRPLERKPLHSNVLWQSCCSACSD